MLKDLKLLAQIQVLDSQIDERKVEKAELPKRLTLFKKGVEGINQEIQKVKGELEDLQKKRRHEERNLEAREIELKKYQRQLYEIKDNRAYTALKEEIVLAKENNETSEEKILKSLELEEERIKGITEIEKKLTEEKGELNIREEKMEERIKVLDQEIAKINVACQELTGKTGPDSLSRYEKLRKGKGGLAIVLLEGSSCGGCHMGLPPQIVNEVKMGDRFVTCENCNRILYWKDANQSENAIPRE